MQAPSRAAHIGRANAQQDSGFAHRDAGTAVRHIRFAARPTCSLCNSSQESDSRIKKKLHFSWCDCLCSSILPLDERGLPLGPSCGATFQGEATIMLKMLIAAAASFAMLSAAAAADLPRRQPPPPAPAPVGKAPIGKFPVGKYPAPAPAPVYTKG